MSLGGVGHVELSEGFFGLTWSLNFDFEEEINPMLGSMKNSSSVKSPNFPQQ